VLISVAEGKDRGRVAACSSGEGEAVDDPAVAGFGGMTSGPLVPQALIRTVMADNSHQGERRRDDERSGKDMAGR
jgi:hypothetical protein